MKNFNQEFLDVDWRKNKPERIGFIINDQKTLHKHQRLLPPELIAGKSVLDIGSYISHGKLLIQAWKIILRTTKRNTILSFVGV